MNFPKVKNMKTSCAIFLTIMLISCNTGKGRSSGVSIGISGDTLVPQISFTEYEHAFGKVKEGEKLKYVFHFENRGPGNLVIESASTTCGCTVTRYDRKPIAPGKEGSLDVVFDTSGKSGMQTKTISVRSNARVPVVFLKITAEVNSNK
jgi:hypothetical protein